MPRSGIFLEASISFLNSVGQSALAQLRTTQEELRTETFDLSKSIGRVALFWMDAIEAAPTAFLTSISGPLPSLFVVLQPDDTTLTRTIRVTPPALRALEFTGLNQVGGATQFDPRTVSIRPTANFGINVIFTDLSVYPPEPGLYQGVVHVGDLALAVIMVQVKGPRKVQRSGKKR